MIHPTKLRKLRYAFPTRLRELRPAGTPAGGVAK